MTEGEFFTAADALAREAGVQGGPHDYFLMHRTRLWATGAHFGLWQLAGKDILEIGPFYSYVPFALAAAGNRVSVVEGDDPVAQPLVPLYRARGIELDVRDLFDAFGAADPARHRLPYPDDRFDVVSCWETMEHFNFNPVGFLKELRRILRPGGTAFVTVPNVARLDGRLRLLLGRPIGPEVASYAEHYAGRGGGKYHGWHWREYTLGELVELFTAQGFEIAGAAHLQTFQDHDRITVARRIKRGLGALAFRVAPSLGSICAVTARKPAW